MNNWGLRCFAGKPYTLTGVARCLNSNRKQSNTEWTPKKAGCILHGYGTPFLLVILRRDYSRAFSRQARIACGNNFPFGKIRKQGNTER